MFDEYAKKAAGRYGLGVAARAQRHGSVVASAAGSRAASGRHTKLPQCDPGYTHEGQAVKFYDDLIRGKVVTFNMM